MEWVVTIRFLNLIQCYRSLKKTTFIMYICTFSDVNEFVVKFNFVFLPLPHKTEKQKLLSKTIKLLKVIMFLITVHSCAVGNNACIDTLCRLIACSHATKYIIACWVPWDICDIWDNLRITTIYSTEVLMLT